ncbi:hypothetical protein Tco_1554484 [Tanacetum coccineum]
MRVRITMLIADIEDDIMDPILRFELEPCQRRFFDLPDQGTVLYVKRIHKMELDDAHSRLESNHYHMLHA